MKFIIIFSFLASTVLGSEFFMHTANPFEMDPGEKCVFETKMPGNLIDYKQEYNLMCKKNDDETTHLVAKGTKSKNGSVRNIVIEIDKTRVVKATLITRNRPSFISALFEENGNVVLQAKCSIKQWDIIYCSDSQGKTILKAYPELHRWYKVKTENVPTWQVHGLAMVLYNYDP